jgi:hypothetical protein
VHALSALQANKPDAASWGVQLRATMAGGARLNYVPRWSGRATVAFLAPLSCS